MLSLFMVSHSPLYCLVEPVLLVDTLRHCWTIYGLGICTGNEAEILDDFCTTNCPSYIQDVLECVSRLAGLMPCT